MSVTTCLRLYRCACTHACTHASTHTRMHTHKHTQTQVHTHTHAHTPNTHAHTQAHVRTRTCIFCKIEGCQKGCGKSKELAEIRKRAQEEQRSGNIQNMHRV